MPKIQSERKLEKAFSSKRPSKINMYFNPGETSNYNKAKINLANMKSAVNIENLQNSAKKEVMLPQMMKRDFVKS